MENAPAVSVVIPMYNVEKYIAECLDSLLGQTFQNFEVIVVDDCSTDLSVEVVESFSVRFGDRLKLVNMKKNAGTAGSPRNKGMEFSRGEYIYFLDSDDTITPTAFEELYSLAKEFDVDIVQCEKFYSVPQSVWNDPERRKKLKPTNYLTGERKFFPKPTWLSDDIEQRIKFFWTRKLIWNVVVQLIRRDFVISNHIQFCDIYAEDLLFTICELCCAEKYLVVPNVIYFYRRHPGTSSNSITNMQEKIHRNVKALALGFRYLDKFLEDRESFSQHIDWKYIVFDVFVNQLTRGFLGDFYDRIPKHEVDKFIRKEFTGDNNALMCYVFNMMNIFRSKFIQSNQQISDLKEQIQALKKVNTLQMANDENFRAAPHAIAD